MRTTIRIDDSLLTEAKQFAARTHRSLTAVIEDGLREVLSRRTAKTRKNRISLPTMKGSGLQPGVDLDDTSSLLDLMEGRDETGRR